ncbi:MAG: hypothetical protein J5I50_01755 [Chitinophagaceae bacterium]|nr:hypothetical protein [Chitinophagaceae bacterium]
MNTTKITYNSLYSSLLVLFIFFGFSLFTTNAGQSCFSTGDSQMIITARGGDGNNQKDLGVEFSGSKKSYLIRSSKQNVPVGPGQEKGVEKNKNIGIQLPSDLRCL